LADGLFIYVHHANRGTFSQRPILCIFHLENIRGEMWLWLMADDGGDSIGIVFGFRATMVGQAIAMLGAIPERSDESAAGDP